jgi:hypothetical protein
MTIDLDAIKARLAAVHAAGISVIHTRLADHGIRVLVSMRDWSGNNRYDADTAVTTLIGNAPADIGALVEEVERLRGEAERERVAVVSWLNGCATEGFILLRINEACAAEKWALAIERGDHCREGAE